MILGSNQRPAGVRLASYIGLRGIILGIQGIEVLFQPLVGGNARKIAHRTNLVPLVFKIGPPSMTCYAGRKTEVRSSRCR